MFQFLRSFCSASKQPSLAKGRRAPRRRSLSFQPRLEQLEIRRVMTATSAAVLDLGDAGQINSYSGVGFQQNEVASLVASLNGKAITSASSLTAEINWGDGSSSAGDFVYLETNGSYGEFLIKGSHTYSETGVDLPITVTVTGSGATKSAETTDADVTAMPSGVPGTQPGLIAGLAAPENVDLELSPEGTVNSYTGVGFQQNDIALLAASLNGKPDTTLTDFHAQINFGDDGSWDTGDLVYLGTNGGYGEYLIKGSHTYQQSATDLPIVVYVNGPDGTSASAETTDAIVTPMPSGIPGTQPSSTASAAPEDVDLRLAPEGQIVTYQGVGFKNDEIATLAAEVNGEPDTSLADFQAQINFGDSAAWSAGSLTYEGTNGGYAEYVITGSHIYEKTSNDMPIVVYATGPDGTSISAETTDAVVQPNALIMSSLSATQWDAKQTGYSGEIALSGGSGNYANSEVTGLPPGLTGTVTNDDIDISGTPTQSGTFNIQVTAEDSKGDTNTNTYTLTINAPLALGSLNPTQWNVNQGGYDGAITITGGTGVYGGLQVSGLPGGLSAVLTGGAIDILGTPTQSGVFTLNVSAQDTDGDQASSTYSLTINAPIGLGALSPTQWNVNQAGYPGAIGVTGGTGSYTNLNVTGLPTGLSASLAGGQISITGTPTQVGTFSFAVSLQDSNGAEATGQYSLKIADTSITLGSLTPAQWNVNQAGYSGTISVSGGAGGYSNLAVTGLPTGLSASLSGSQITITGTPTQAGTFSLAVSLQDSSAAKASGQYSLTINQPSAGSLTTSVNYNTVHPTAASNLNLYFFFGNEGVTTPVTISNTGGAAVSGAVTVTLYLSKTATLTGTPITLATQSNVAVNLAAGAQQTLNIAGTIPTTLTAGGQYYLVAKVTSTNIKNLANTTAATAKTFEFVGAPSSNPAVFSSGLFYQFVSNTLQGVSPIPASANVSPSNAQSFIAYFEGDYQHPYLDSSGYASLGVGINLTTVSGALAHSIAQDVRAYYSSTYHQTLSSNDTTVINMLISQAKANSKTQVISVASDQALFQQAYPVYASLASSTLGSAWNNLNAQQQTAVIDLVYNMGSLSSFPGYTSALKANDLLQAGFQLVDAVRTTQAPGLTTRTQAEFQALFTGHVGLLGQII